MTEITATQVKELREQTGLGMMDCKKALNETSGDLSKAVEYLRKQGMLVAAKRAGREAKEGKVVLANTGTCVVAVELNCETDFVSSSDDFNQFANSVITTVADEMPEDLDALKTLGCNGSTLEEIKDTLMGKTGEKINIRRYAIEKLSANEYAETYSHMGGKIGVLLKLSASAPIPPSDTISNLAKDLTMQVAALNPLAVKPEDVPSEVLDKEREIYRELALKEGKPAEFVDKIVEGRISKFYKENCLINQVFVKDSKISVKQLVSNIAKELNLDKLEVASFHRLQLGQ